MGLTKASDISVAAPLEEPSFLTNIAWLKEGRARRPAHTLIFCRSPKTGIIFFTLPKHRTSRINFTNDIFLFEHSERLRSR